MSLDQKCDRRLLVGLTIVRNESDIIEVFVRYHVAFLDALVILDSGSSDGTLEILGTLRHQGVPLYLHYSPDPAFNQAQSVGRLMRWTCDILRPDWIFLLDADEFIAREAGPVRRSDLVRALRGESPIALQWRTYVPTPNDNEAEPNPIRRIRYRRQFEATIVSKMVVPGKLGKRNDLCISQGGHRVFLQDEVIPATRCELLHLAHFPVRGAAQAKRKYLVGWLANLSRPYPALFDWSRLYRASLREEFDPSILSRLAYSYNAENETDKFDILEDPLSVGSDQGDVLIASTESPEDWLIDVMRFAECLAHRHSEAQRCPKPQRSYFLELQRCLELWHPTWQLAIREILEIVRLLQEVASNRRVLVIQHGGYELAAAASIAFTGDSHALHHVMIHVEKSGAGVPSVLRDSGFEFCTSLPTSAEQFDFVLVGVYPDACTATTILERVSNLVAPDGLLAIQGTTSIRRFAMQQVAERVICSSELWGQPYLEGDILLAHRKADRHTSV